MENSGKYSCLDCIWCTQCGGNTLCDFFDVGRDPTDEEIELFNMARKEAFCEQYKEYVSEYGDGNHE